MPSENLLRLLLLLMLMMRIMLATLVPFRKGKSVSELVTKVDNDQTQVD